jgi:hypothetical protein
MAWLFRSHLFGEKIISLKNGGTQMTLKLFLLLIDTRLKDFSKPYHHISLKVPFLRIMFWSLKHLLVPPCHQPQPLSFLPRNELEFRDLETSTPLMSLLFLFILVKEGLQLYSMMKIIMIP